MARKDVSTIVRSGTISSPVKFAVLKSKQNELFCYFTITSHFDSVGTTMEEKTNVAVLGEAVEELRTKTAEELKDAHVVIASAMAYVSKSGELCCRVTAPEQLQITVTHAGEKFANAVCEETSAEDFFLQVGCSVDGKTKN